MPLGTRGATVACFCVRTHAQPVLPQHDARLRSPTAWLEPLWPFTGAVVLCVVVDVQLLYTAWEAYVAKPWLWPAAVMIEMVILVGVMWWRTKELARLELERAAIESLRGELKD